MNKTLRTLLMVIVVLIGAAALVGTGFAFGRSPWGMSGYSGNGMMGSQGGYGMMGPGMMMGNSGNGSGGGMMDGFGLDNNGDFPDISADLSVSPEAALEAAQSYLDQYFPGAEVSDEITLFYGYYTIDFENDDEITGMLSVNGFTRQVFPHTWHGEFIEMSEE